MFHCCAMTRVCSLSLCFRDLRNCLRSEVLLCNSLYLIHQFPIFMSPSLSPSLSLSSSLFYSLNQPNLPSNLPHPLRRLLLLSLPRSLLLSRLQRPQVCMTMNLVGNIFIHVWPRKKIWDCPVCLCLCADGLSNLVCWFKCDKTMLWTYRSSFAGLSMLGIVYV